MQKSIIPKQQQIQYLHIYVQQLIQHNDSLQASNQFSKLLTIMFYIGIVTNIRGAMKILPITIHTR